MSLRHELPSAGLGLGGMLLTLGAVGAWRSGTGVNVTGGSVAVLAILIVGTALVVRYSAPLVRAIATSAWLAIVFAVAPVAVFVCALLLFGRTVLLTLPMGPSLVVGMLALAVSTFLALRRAGSLEDPVVGPPQADGVGTLEIFPTLDRTGGKLTPWLFLLLTAVMCLPLLVL